MLCIHLWSERENKYLQIIFSTRRSPNKIIHRKLKKKILAWRSSQIHMSILCSICSNQPTKHIIGINYQFIWMLKTSPVIKEGNSASSHTLNNFFVISHAIFKPNKTPLKFYCERREKDNNVFTKPRNSSAINKSPAFLRDFLYMYHWS